MSSYKKYFGLVFAGIFGLIFLLANSLNTFGQQLTASEPKPEVKSLIEEKNKELQQLNSQIQQVQGQLDVTQNQKTTLSREINKIDTSIKQLDLGIKKSKVVAEKLSLEIDDTQEDISESEKKINEKKSIIMESLKNLYQQEETNNPLVVFLRNNNLSEAIIEAQNLMSVQDQITLQIEDLRNLKGELNQYLDSASSKKKEKEVEVINLASQKEIIAETKEERQKLLAETKNKESNYQKSLSLLQKRQQEIAMEIERIEAEARKQIKSENLPTSGTGTLAMPAQGKLTQGYGATAFASTAYKSKWHNGIDIAGPIGTPIYAAEDGVVNGVANQDLYCYKGAYGKFVTISHNNNLTTLYAHLSLQKVSEGQRVKRGELIGYMGNTGFSTGPHLHFTVYSTPTFKIGAAKLSCGPKMPYGGDLNPLNYLDKSELAMLKR